MRSIMLASCILIFSVGARAESFNFGGHNYIEGLNSPSYRPYRSQYRGNYHSPGNSYQSRPQWNGYYNGTGVRGGYQYFPESGWNRYGYGASHRWEKDGYIPSHFGERLR
jgi:hypothetical protein